MFICCRPISPLQEWHYSKLFNLQTNQVLQVGFVVTVTQEASLRESARLQQKAENLAVGSALIVAHADCWVKTENIIYVSGKHRRSVQLMQLSVGSPGAFLACIKWEKKRGKLCESLENHPLALLLIKYPFFVGNSSLGGSLGCGTLWEHPYDFWIYQECDWKHHDLYRCVLQRFHNT